MSFSSLAQELPPFLNKCWQRLAATFLHLRFGSKLLKLSNLRSRFSPLPPDLPAARLGQGQRRPRPESARTAPAEPLHKPL